MNPIIRNPLYVILFVVVWFATTFTTAAQDTASYKRWFTEKLNRPFGTFVTLGVEVFEGEKLHDKGHQSDYLFKIKTVDSVLLPEPIIMEFKDETGYFPSDDFQLYKYLYGVDTGYLDDKMVKKINKRYSGSEFTIIAYESGEFTGLPNGYGKYVEAIRQDVEFYFKHYLIVVSDLSKGNWHEKKGFAD